jgi:hypothetical protein
LVDSSLHPSERSCRAGARGDEVEALDWYLARPGG